MQTHIFLYTIYSMDRMYRIFAVSILFLLVVGVGWAVITRFDSRPTDYSTGLSSLEHSEKKKTIEWKTYMNRDYGYSLKYPMNWEIVPWDITDASNLTRVPDGSIWQQATFQDPASDAQFEVIVWENASQVPARTWVSWFRHEDLVLSDVPTTPNATLSALDAISYVQYETSRGVPRHFLFVTKNGRIYELVFNRPDISETDAAAQHIPPHSLYDAVVQSFVLL